MSLRWECRRREEKFRKRKKIEKQKGVMKRGKGVIKKEERCGNESVKKWKVGIWRGSRGERKRKEIKEGRAEGRKRGRKGR